MAIRKWINDHPKIILLLTSLSLLTLLGMFVAALWPETKLEYEYRDIMREGTRRHPRSKRRSKPTVIGKQLSQKEPPQKVEGPKVSKGRLVFKRLQMKCKSLSGETAGWGYSELLPYFDEHGGVVRCGDSVDVIWSYQGVGFVKEKGLMEEVLGSRERPEPYYDDVVWDGAYVWVGTRNRGILLLDTSAKTLQTIGSETGLPPADKRIRLWPIDPGKILAAGSFGPHGRTWCATIEFKDGRALANVFHEAKQIPVKRGARKEAQNDPALTFDPYWIREDSTTTRRTVLVARCEAKYMHRHPLRYPLEIDLDNLSVTVSSRPMSFWEEQESNLEYKGNVYIPGKIWYRHDLNTGNKEPLMNVPLPKPYRAMERFWVTAHSGLIGFGSSNCGFFSIDVADEEQIYGYYHTFRFEDENDPITDTKRLKEMRIDVRDGDMFAQYRYGDFVRGGWFITGKYEPTIPGRKVKGCKFIPMEVDEDSPEQLVFKAIPPERRYVLYRGLIVNAITGEAIEGAFVIVGFQSNLAWITPQEWKELHKLPIDPSPEAEAVRPIKDTSNFPLRAIARTGPKGRFEIRSRTGQIVHEIVAFEQNYVSTTLPRRYFGRAQDGRFDLPAMPLFPAAKVVIEPRVDCQNVLLDLIPEANDNSPMAAAFVQMQPGYVPGPQLVNARVEPYLRQPHYVPAGLNFRLRFSIPYEDQWTIPEIPQEINLRQGETLDLGRFIFERGIRVFLKVLDSSGNPIRGVPVVRFFDDPYHHIEALQTDENGRIPYNVEPNSEVKFRVYRDTKKWEVLKNATIKIGGRDDSGKEFVIGL
ncbi:MAG: hypothetical protein ACYTEL_17470 [Planctomycetota bacterium]|jgi:hypothetical protein